MNAIDRAIEIVGGQSELSRCCGVKPQAVQQWKASGRVPATRVLVVERATGGKVTRHELRPDVFGEA